MEIVRLHHVDLTVAEGLLELIPDLGADVRPLLPDLLDAGWPDPAAPLNRQPINMIRGGLIADASEKTTGLCSLSHDLGYAGPPVHLHPIGDAWKIPVHGYGSR